MTTIPSKSTDDHRWHRPSAMRSVDLGGVRVTHVPDGSIALRPGFWLPAATTEDLKDNAELFDENGDLAAGIGSLLVGTSVLIDAGLGPRTFPDHPDNPIFAHMTGGQLPANLTDLGIDTHDIEAVLLTHLHLDHIGWLLHPDPATGDHPFADARLYIHLDEWAARHHAIDTGALTADDLAYLEPRVTTFDNDQTVLPGIRSLRLPGHTRGHTGFLLTGHTHRLWATGDAMHTPLQIPHPDWSPLADYDQIDAATTRTQLVETLADTPDLVYAQHFADVVFGTIHRHPSGDAHWKPHTID